MKKLYQLNLIAVIAAAIAFLVCTNAIAFQQSSIQSTQSYAYEETGGIQTGDVSYHGPQQLHPRAMEVSNGDDVFVHNAQDVEIQNLDSVDDWFSGLKVGFDNGFVIANQNAVDLEADDYPFLLRFNGWGQLRHTILESGNAKPDQNFFQLKRARLIFSGSAFTPDFSYYVQLDGRSSSGDDVRLLDYFLTYDLGSHRFGLDRGTFGFKTGRYKIPFTMSRSLSGREFEFTDRSVASTFFDVNRSLAWGIYGRGEGFYVPFYWESAIFNGLVTGGAETGSAGSLDDNFAFSSRIFSYHGSPWGMGELADFECHTRPAVRIGCGFANSTIDSSGSTEFSRVRVADSGETLASTLPVNQMGAPFVSEYTVNLFCLDYSMKYRGWSVTCEYYLRSINQFRGASVPNLFDHGHWLQVGKFIVPGKVQLLARWSSVVGDSGTLGQFDQSSQERSLGFAQYFRDQHAKLVIDATYLDGAPISSSALDISPGDSGWLIRSQIQFAF